MGTQSGQLIPEEEIARLEANENLRQKIIKAHFDEDGTFDASDPEITNAALRALKDSDTTVLKKADIAVKAQDAQANAETLAMVSEILKRVNTNPDSSAAPRNVELTDDYIPNDIKPGETDEGVIPVELSEIMGEDNAD